ncbi:hypothetical protein HDV04_003489 [Boothiomyces sp. JEL0838]|nr:hypothetical protein HDV04_003489 [Boothiomyces sp. JEL0838]
MKKTNNAKLKYDKLNPNNIGWDNLSDSYISSDGLLTMFENEARYLLKSLHTTILSRTNASQYRIITFQFLGCLEKYKKYLDKKVFLQKCLDFGDQLLEIKGCHNLAFESCFTCIDNYISAMPTIAPIADGTAEKSIDIHEIKAKLYFSEIVVEFLTIVNIDFSVRHSKSVDDVEQVLVKLKENIYRFAHEDSTMKWTILMTVYHIFQIAKFLVSIAKPKMAKESILWVLNFLESQKLYEISEISSIYIYMLLKSYRWIFIDSEDQVGIEYLKGKSALFSKNSTSSQESLSDVTKLIDIFLASAIIKSKIGPKPSIQEAVKMLISNSSPITAMSFVENFNWKKQLQSISGWKPDFFLFSYSIFKFPVNFQIQDSRHLEIYRSLISQYNISLDECSHLDTSEYATKEEIKIDGETAKKSEKKKIIKEDSEDVKIKKGCWEEINAALNLFNTPTQQFSAIIGILDGLLTHEKRVKIPEKVDENTLKEYIVSLLLEKAFNLLSGSFSMKAEIKEKRQHFEGDQTEVPRTELCKFDIYDIVKLSQFLFTYRSWSRLEKIVGVIHTFPLKHKHPLFLETNLRLSASKFLLSFQIDRKVFFQSNLAGRATPSDFRASRFELAEQVQHTIAIFCNSILECLDSHELLIKSPYLIIDSALLLWNFVEPFLRDIKSTLDSPKIYHLKSDDAIMLVLGFIHSIFCKLHYFTDHHLIVLGVGISQKLALIYECMGEFDRAMTVLKECLGNINRAREINIGGAVDIKDCITADPSYHKIYPESEGDQVIRDFACLEVDVLSFYYRCVIEHDYEENLCKLRKKQEETLKLRHIKLDLAIPYESPNEAILLKYCGDDPVKRSIFLLSTILHGKGIPFADRSFLLRKAVNYLKEGRRQENVLFEQLKIAGSNTPTFIRRTSNSISVAIPNIDGENKWYQVFGNFSDKNIKASNVNGAGIMRPLLQNSTATLYGLQKDCKYHVAFSLYPDIYADSTTGAKLKSNSIPIVAALPLSINLCWTYVLSIASRMDDKEIVNQAMKNLESQFIKSKCTVESLRNFVDDKFDGSSNAAIFEMNYKTLGTTNQAIIRGFIQCFFYYIELRKAEFNQSDQSNSILLSQYFRFELCRDFLIASECAKYTGQPTLEILCVVKLYQEILPFLKTDIYTPFILNILVKCHDTLLKQSGAFENDKSKGLREFLVPVTFHLVTRLIELGNVTLAAQIAYDTNSLINISTYSADIKIINSNMMETSLLGYIYKPHKGKAKRSSSNYLAEFGYLGRLAVTKPSKFGVSFHRKQFDMFYELMEVLMVKHKAIPPSLMNDPNVKKNVSRKTLDSTTTLKDIFTLFITAGPETTMQELTKFRKNPRYVEIVTRIVSWCIEKDSIETAIRLSLELEDWVDRRDHVRGREGDKKDDTRRVVVEPSPERKIGGSRPNSTTPSLTSGSSGSRHSSRDRPHSTPSTPPRGNVSRANSASPKNSSNGSPKRDLSRANSASPPAINHEDAAESELTSIQLAKRKRATHRHAYFNGMSNTERDRVDQAIKVLDTKLYYLWHRRCYARRLRLILDYENPWRSSLLYFRAKALFIQHRKDSKLFQFNLNDFKENSLVEWLEFRSSASFMIKQLNKKESSIDPNGSQHTQAVDMIQSFTQSIVIASRSFDPLKIIKYSKSLWVSLRFMFYNGRLDLPFWKQTLWRGLITVGNAILDTLKAIQISKVPKGNTFSQSHTYPSSKKGVIPVQTYFEITHDQFIGSWTDRQQFNQHQIFDLAFCSEFLLFIIEVIHTAGKYHRLLNFTKKVQNYFSPAMDSLLNPLLKYCQEAIKNNELISKPVVDYRDDRPAEEALYYCRYKVAAYQLECHLQGHILHENAAVNTEIYTAFECVISKSIKEKNYTLAALASFEFGNFLHEIGDHAGSATFWSRGLDHLTGKPKVLKSLLNYLEINPKSRFSEENARVIVDKLGGILLAIQASNALVRIGRFTFCKNFDKQLECVWIAAHLNIACLYYTIPNPTNYMEYVDFQLDKLYSSNDLFMLKHELNPVEFVENIHYMSNVLIQNNMAAASLPMLAVADYVSKNVLCSIPMCSTTLIIKSEALVQIGLINEGINHLYLASKANPLKKKVEDGGMEFQFENNSYPLTGNHFLVLKQLLISPLSEKTKLHNTARYIIDYDIARMRLVLKVFELAEISNNTTPCDEFEAYKLEANRIDLPKLDYDGWQLDIITGIRGTIFKHVQTIQTAIKGKLDTGNTNEIDLKYNKELDIIVTNYYQLIMLFDILLQTFFIQKRALSIRKLISTLKSGDRHRQNIFNALTSQLGKTFLISNLEVIIRSLFAEGKYLFAYSLAKTAEEEYSSFNSNLIYARVLATMAKILIYSGQDDQSLKHTLKCLQKVQEKLNDHPMALLTLVKCSEIRAAADNYFHHQKGALYHYEHMDNLQMIFVKSYFAKVASTSYWESNIDYLLKNFLLLRCKLIVGDHSSNQLESLTENLRYLLFDSKYKAHMDLITVLKYSIALDSFKARTAYSLGSTKYVIITNFVKVLLQSFMQTSVVGGSIEKKYHASLMQLTLQVENRLTSEFDIYFQVYKFSQCKLIASTSENLGYKDVPISIQIELDNFKSMEKDDPIFDSVDLLAVDENSITEKYKGFSSHSITTNDIRMYRKSLTDIFDCKPIGYNERYLSSITRFLRLQRCYKDKIEEVQNGIKISPDTQFYFMTWLYLPIIDPQNNLPLEIIDFARDISIEKFRIPVDTTDHAESEKIESSASKPNSRETVETQDSHQTIDSEKNNFFNLNDTLKPENNHVMVMFCNRKVTVEIMKQSQTDITNETEIVEKRVTKEIIKQEVLVRNIPKVVVQIGKNSINSIYSKLAFFALTKDQAVKEQAESLWKSVLTLLHQIIHKEYVIPKTFPTLTNSNVSVLAAIFALETVGGSDKDKIKNSSNPFIAKLFPEVKEQPQPSPADNQLLEWVFSFE